MRPGLGFVFCVCLGAALIAGAPPLQAQVHARPLHVMSLNMCTDALVLELLPPDRIASVTYLAENFTQEHLKSRLRHVAINYGTTEEVLRQKPDLVLAGISSTPMTRVLLKKFGLNMVEIPSADDFGQIRAVTRQVAALLDERAAGEALLRRMDAELAQLAATRPRRTIRVAGWSGGGSVPGKGTLFDTILTAAGGVNIAAADARGTRYGSFDIEQLLMARPDVLAYGANAGSRPGLRTDEMQNPLVLKLFRNRRITYPELFYSCGLPQVSDAVRDLRASLLRAAARKTGS